MDSKGLTQPCPQYVSYLLLSVLYRHLIVKKSMLWPFAPDTGTDCTLLHLSFLTPLPAPKWEQKYDNISGEGAGWRSLKLPAVIIDLN